MKAEFFNIHDFLVQTNLVSRLKETKYIVKDRFQNLIHHSHSSADLKRRFSFSIKFKNEQYGEIEVEDDSLFSQTMFDREVVSYVTSIEGRAWISQSDVLTKDLISIFKNSEVFFKKPLEVYYELLDCLKSHLFSEKVIFYTVLNQNILSPLVGIDGITYMDHEDLEDIWLFEKASVVATSRKFYWETFEEGDRKNVVGIPIIHTGKVVGVFLLVDRVFPTLSEYDHEVIRRFSRYTGHILEEKVLTEELKQSEKISESLSIYLSSNVADDIKHQGQSGIGGVEKEITVLFLLIQNIEKALGRRNPTESVKLLNLIYEACHKVGENYNGTLDKIMTPAMMFVWNHPLRQPNAVALAVECALEMREEFRSKITPLLESRGILDVGIGIGINRGIAVAGNLGCNEFADYTVIGDSINTAQRLESNAGKNEIIVSASAYHKLYHKVQIGDKAMTIEAKGKSEPIRCYLLGD